MIKKFLSVALCGLLASTAWGTPRIVDVDTLRSADHTKSLLFPYGVTFPVTDTLQSFTPTNHSVVISGPATTASLAAPGTAGWVLTSNGPAADPSFQPGGGGGSSLNTQSFTDVAPVLTTNLRTYASQLTDTAAGERLIETGNFNYLANPGFEHSTVATGWTVTGATGSAESLRIHTGNQALKLVLSSTTGEILRQTLNGANNNGVYNAAFTAETVYASIHIHNAGALSNLQWCIGTWDGVSVFTDVQCAPVSASFGYIQTVSVEMALTAASNANIGVRLKDTGTESGTIYVDDARLGPNPLNINTVGAAWTHDGVNVITSTNGAGNDPTKGTTYADARYWKQNGPNMDVLIQYAQNTVGGAGNGYYLWEIPNSASCTIDPSVAPYIITGNIDQYVDVGFGTMAAPGSLTVATVVPYDATHVRIGWSNDWQGSGTYQFSISTMTVGMQFSVPCVGWTGSGSGGSTPPTGPANAIASYNSTGNLNWSVMSTTTNDIIYANPANPVAGDFRAIAFDPNGAGPGNVTGISINNAMTSVNNLHLMDLSNGAVSGAGIVGTGVFNSGNATNDINMQSVNNSGNMGGQLRLMEASNSGTAAGGILYNIYNQNTGVMSADFNLMNLSDSATTTGNWQGLSINKQGNVTGAVGFLGGNLDADVTSNVNLINIGINNTHTIGGSFQGMNLYHSSNVTGNSTMMNLTDNGSSNGKQGLNIGLTGTTSSYVTGLSVNVGSVTGFTQQPVAADLQGGALSVQSPYDTATLTPVGEFQNSSLGGQFHIASGFPVTGAFGFGNNLGITLLAEDDMGPDLFLGSSSLGFSVNGFVNQVAVVSGKTVDTLNYMAAGGSFPAASTGGTVVNTSMFRALGLLNGGGTLSLTNLWGFKADGSLCGASPTKCWGVSVEDTTADNWFAKDVVVGGTTMQPTNASVGVEVAGTTKSLLLSRLTTVQKNALTATNGMIVYDTTLDEFSCYVAGAWASCGGSSGSGGAAGILVNYNMSAAVVNNSSPVLYNNLVYDNSAGAYNAATGEFTAPGTGFYIASWSATSVSRQSKWDLQVDTGSGFNSVASSLFTVGANAAAQGSAAIFLTVGDKVRVINSTGSAELTSSTLTDNRFEIMSTGLSPGAVTAGAGSSGTPVHFAGTYAGASETTDCPTGLCTNYAFTNPTVTVTETNTGEYTITVPGGMCTGHLSCQVSGLSTTTTVCAQPNILGGVATAASATTFSFATVNCTSSVGQDSHGTFSCDCTL